MSTQSLQNNGKPANSGFIARKLAAALGSFCEIDETLIRSRLLNPKKSKICLKDVRLKPRPIKENCEQAILVTGTVEEVVLRWKWNVMKGSIKQSSLMFRGVKLQMRPLSQQELALIEAKERLSSASFDSAKSENESPQKGNEKEKKQPKFLKKIRLNIEDIELHIELPSVPGNPLTLSKKTLIICGNQIELESLGTLNVGKLQHKARTRKRRKDVNNRQHPLLQQLRIGSLSARIINIDSDGRRTTLPFMDPFQYSAMIKRFHGQRFEGVGEGLDVKGEVLPIAGRTSVVPIVSFSEEERDDPDTSFTSSTGEVEIYADDEAEEIETRLSLAMSTSWEDDRTYGSYDSRDYLDDDPPIDDGIKLYLGSLQTVALLSTIKMFASKPKTVDAEIDEKTPSNVSRGPLIGPGSLASISMSFLRSTKDLNKSSVYDFPFQNIQVVLPNKSLLMAKECAFKLQADGTKCVFEGSGGVHVDGAEVLVPGSSWAVDMIEEDIVIEPRQIPIQSFMNDRRLHFEIGLSSITGLATGIGEIVKLKKLIDPKPHTSQTRISQRSKWDLKVNGTTDIKF